MALTLGEKLRQAREARGISVTEVAEQTRISRLYLEAIENDDYRPLPGGIFNKGFVKSYARHVGIDEAEALQDYTRIIAEQEGVQGDEPKTYRPEVLTDDNSSSSTLLTIIFAVVILGLMTWGILALVRYVSENPLQIANTDTGNANTAANTNTNPTALNPTPTPSNAPTMNDLTVEFKTSGEPISLSSTSDGKRASFLVTSENSAKFEPKENLNLSFAKVLLPNARLTINDKPVTLPPSLVRANRNTVQFEINKDNLGQIWQNGEITAGNENQPANSANTSAR